MRPSLERLTELRGRYHISSERMRKIALAYSSDLGSAQAGAEGVEPIDEVERLLRTHSARLAVILEAIANADADPERTGEAIQLLEVGLRDIEIDLQAMEALVGPVEAAVAAVRTERIIN